MATRSFIGIENEDGTVEAIYCHWDGNPEYNGRILSDHYSDPARLRQLLGGGSLSALAPSIDPPDGVPHTFDDPADGVCIYYGRDRGEARHTIASRDYLSKSDYRQLTRSLGANYIYLLGNDGRWRFIPQPYPDRCRWKILDTAATTK